jgi:hypothetical protein
MTYDLSKKISLLFFLNYPCLGSSPLKSIPEFKPLYPLSICSVRRPRTANVAYIPPLSTRAWLPLFWGFQVHPNPVPLYWIHQKEMEQQPCYWQPSDEEIDEYGFFGADCHRKRNLFCRRRHSI